MYFPNFSYTDRLSALTRQVYNAESVQPTFSNPNLLSSFFPQQNFQTQSMLEATLLQLQYMNNKANNALKASYYSNPLPAPTQNQALLNLKLMNDYNTLSLGSNYNLQPSKPETKQMFPLLEFVMDQKAQITEDLKLAREDDSLTIKSSAQCEKPKIVAPPKKVAKKKAQNRIKNIPGLIMQRVRSSIKHYYTLNSRFDKKEKRLNYIDDIIKSLSKVDKERLNAFLEGYQKNWKTWNTIQKFLQSDTKYGEIVLEIVLGFFNKSGEEDFNEWLNSGKMGDKSRHAVNEMKDHIMKKFSKILTEANLEDSLEKSEKNIKTEESC